MAKFMLLCLCSLLACIAGQRITTIQLDGVQYFISRMNPYSPELNYFLAYQYCRSLGLQLASFETKEKVESMTQYLQNAGYSKYDFWTSGNRLGTGMFLWMSTGLPFNATFDFFENSADAAQAGLLDPVDHNSNTAPQRTARDSNSGLEKGCVMLKAPSLKWMPEDCSTVKDFICEQTRCYYYNYGSIPVSSAQGRPITSTTLRSLLLSSTTPLPLLNPSSTTIAATLKSQFNKKLPSSSPSSSNFDKLQEIPESSSSSSSKESSLNVHNDDLIQLTEDNGNNNQEKLVKNTENEQQQTQHHSNNIVLLSAAETRENVDDDVDEIIENDENENHEHHDDEDETRHFHEDEDNTNEENHHQLIDNDDHSLSSDESLSSSLPSVILSSSSNEQNNDHISEISSVEERLKQISHEIEKLGHPNNPDTQLINHHDNLDIGSHHQSFLSLSDLIKTLRPNDKKIPQIDSDYSNTMRVLGESSSLISTTSNNNNNNDDHSSRKFRDTDATIIGVN